MYFNTVLLFPISISLSSGLFHLFAVWHNNYCFILKMKLVGSQASVLFLEWCYWMLIFPCLPSRCRLAHFVHSTSVFTLILRLSPAQESFLPCYSVVSCTEWIFRLQKQRHGKMFNMCDLEHLSFFSVLFLSSFIK